MTEDTFKNHARDFSAWLARQIKRQEPVGHFALDWLAGDCCKSEPLYYWGSIVEHLRGKHGVTDDSPAMRAANRAWREYGREL